MEAGTLAWNAVGIIVLAVAAIGAGSVALAASLWTHLSRLGASTVVLWELAGTGEHRQRRALKLIAFAFVGLAAGKRRTGLASDNPVLITEARVTVIDGLRAVAVLIELLLNAVVGAWWADHGRRIGDRRPTGHYRHSVRDN